MNRLLAVVSILLVIAAATGVIAHWYLGNHVVPTPVPSQRLEVVSFVGVPGWKTYRDSRAGFSVQYPPSLTPNSEQQSDYAYHAAFWFSDDTPFIVNLGPDYRGANGSPLNYPALLQGEVDAARQLSPDSFQQHSIAIAGRTGVEFSYLSANPFSDYQDLWSEVLIPPSSEQGTDYAMISWIVRNYSAKSDKDNYEAQEHQMLATFQFTNHGN